MALNIVVDTNVLYELLRPRPAPAVLAWFARQAGSSLVVSCVTQAEMLLGGSSLPSGVRGKPLEAALYAMFGADFQGRFWPFDEWAAPRYAAIVSTRRATGRPVSQFDAQIAAIASARGAALATRRIADFEGCGPVLHDPWAAAG